MVCNVRLTLNGSEYEMVEMLEEKDIIPNCEILNLKTDQGNNLLYHKWAIISYMYICPWHHFD